MLLLIFYITNYLFNIMKSYTDVEQSKKLVGILPLESADMLWMKETKDYYEAVNVPYIESTAEEDDGLPCWSLATLLNMIPNPSLHRVPDGWRCDCYDKDGNFLAMSYGETPVDACYEIIIRLYNLKIL